jgi:hypothetical protein
MRLSGAAEMPSQLPHAAALTAATLPDADAPDDLARLESILAASPRARSPLFRWLLDHFDEVSRLVRRYGRNWTAMAAGLNELGVTRRNGVPVSADSLRKTWADVQRIETARRKEAAIAGRRSGAVEAAPVPGPSPEPEFAPVRLRSGYRAAAPGISDGPRHAAPDGKAARELSAGSDPGRRS